MVDFQKKKTIKFHSFKKRDWMEWDNIQLINFLLRNRVKKLVAFEEFKDILNIKIFLQDLIGNSHLIEGNTMMKKNLSSNGSDGRLDTFPKYGSSGPQIKLYRQTNAQILVSKAR